MGDQLIQIEVCYASTDVQFLINLSVAEGTTVRNAITVSGVLGEFPEIDLSINKVGIYNHECSLDDILTDGDRVEIYRVLVMDPKQARRRRAKGK